MSSSSGSREEMLDVLNSLQKAMARRVPAAPTSAVATAPLNTPVLPITTPRQAAPSEAKDNRSHFFDTWCRRIEMFIADSTKTVLELPSDIGANDRRELHGLAEKYNLSHISRGTGAERQMIFKKDALHYRMPDARPDGLDALKQQGGPGEKQSKFHLRHIRSDPDAATGTVGSFADEETAQMVRRLSRATDEYRKAVEVGYSQDELLAIEAGESVEALLRRPAAAEEATCVASSPSFSSPVLQTCTAVTASNKAQNINTGSNSGNSKVYDQVCLRCGERSRLDYDVHKWECNGYCAVCARQTVWKLVEIHNDTDELVTASNRKRHRDSTLWSSPLSSQLPKQENHLPGAEKEQIPEEIDKENEEDDTITVEDAVDIASMNDFCAADVNWLRRFALHHQPPGSGRILSERVVFCIEFDDLRGMRIFRSGTMDTDSSSAKRARVEDGWFLRLREPKEAGIPLATLLEEVSAALPTHYDDLAVAFTNASVYGTAATCVCQLRTALPESPLAEMQKKYGSRHFRYARELDAVLREEDKNA